MTRWIWVKNICHSDEWFLRGLPISRAIAEESEIAQARPERRVYIGTGCAVACVSAGGERLLRRKDFPTKSEGNKSPQLDVPPTKRLNKKSRTSLRGLPNSRASSEELEFAQA